MTERRLARGAEFQRWRITPGAARTCCSNAPTTSTPRARPRTRPLRADLAAGAVARRLPRSIAEEGRAAQRGGLRVVYHLAALRTRRRCAPRLPLLERAGKLAPSARRSRFVSWKTRSARAIRWAPGAARMMKERTTSTPIHGVPSRSWSEQAYSRARRRARRPTTCAARGAVATSIAEVAPGRDRSDGYRAAVVTQLSRRDADYGLEFDSCKRTELRVRGSTRDHARFARGRASSDHDADARGGARSHAALSRGDRALSSRSARVRTERPRGAATSPSTRRPCARTPTLSCSPGSASGSRARSASSSDGLIELGGRLELRRGSIRARVRGLRRPRRAAR